MTAERALPGGRGWGRVRRCRLAAMAEDGVNDRRDRGCGVDGDGGLRARGGRCVVAEDQGAFGRGGAPFVGPAVEAALQRRAVDFEDEDRVEEIEEAGAVARAAAEEGGGMGPVGRARRHHAGVPDMVVMDEGRIAPMRGDHARVEPRARPRIALTGQHAVAMHDIVAAPFQFGRDRGLAAARAAFDEIVPDAHRSPDRAPRQPSARGLYPILAAAAIHVLLHLRPKQDVDGRDEPGHDGLGGGRGHVPSGEVVSRCRPRSRPDRRGRRASPAALCASASP